MSISASIDITLKDLNNTRCLAVEVIQILMNCEWNLHHNGDISYQPIGTKKIVTWEHRAITFEDLTKILKIKEDAHEINGVIITWKDTDIGGDLLFWPKKISCKTLSLNFNAFRPTIKLQENYEITDFQWYLEKLLPPLNDAFGVEYFSFEQHI